MIDADRIAETAIALWRERGFRTTGWKDIAEATGVSVRTLIRHFGSRAEIPWTGVEAAAARLEASLETVTSDIPTGEALRRAIVSSVTHSEQIYRAAPGWLEVVASEPELMVVAPRAYAPWAGAIARFIALRNPSAPAAISHALAAAYQAAAFAALADWASAGAVGAPDLAVDRTLRWLDVHGSVTDDGSTPRIQEEPE
ncbi:hypothetical protein MSA03_25280 [Microbacterium saccharophilum]|uniref:TetR family transcriptional regulator n=1 Tax=Microbacterium saccharophilum TaxID=1213358 RepID=UPI0011962491|nr:TetR family transcriptional regulator [Microbacterium saccharophilum]GEP49020.1 hypothetical protein MSA03_25280 [Microbacterium saccharophilum]